MPGRPMSITKAVKTYKRKILPERGGKFVMENSSGNEVRIEGNKIVYHRGDGKFAVSKKRQWYRDQLKHQKGTTYGTGKLHKDGTRVKRKIVGNRNKKTGKGRK
jgi:hypothetical protein